MSRALLTLRTISALLALASISARAQTLTGTDATQTLNVQTGAVTGTTAASLPTTGTLTLGGTAGTLTVTSSGATSNPVGLTFSVGGYTLLAGATYTALTTSTLTLNAGTTTLGLALAPSDGLAVNGPGTLVFSTNQTFSGTTTVSAGTLRLGIGGTTGTVAGNIALGGFSILSGSSNGSVVFNRSDDLTYAGVISSTFGSNSLAKQGAGVLTLTGVSTFTGSTTVSAGTLRLGASTGALPTATALTVASGATFDVNGRTTTVGSLDGAGNVTLGSGTLTTGSGTFSGVISGPGGLAKTGAGTLVLTGANTFLAPAIVTAGTLQIGDGGSTGTLPGDVVLGAFDAGTATSTNGHLVFNRGDDITYGGVVSSASLATGSLQKQGAGVLTLTGVSTFTGATTVSAGTLRLGASTGALPSATALTVASGATFDVNGRTTTVGSLDGAGNVALGSGNLSASSGTFSGVASGSGGLTKTGAGTLTLTGANTYTGSTTVSAGTLAVTTSSLPGTAVSIASGAVLDFSQSITGTYAGAISGAGAVTKSGSGIARLTGANTYTGPTTVSGGTLQVSVASLPTATVAVAADATLDFAQTTSATYAGVVGGAGGLTKSGDIGVLTLTAAQTYTGATTVSAGTLRLGASGVLPTSTTANVNGTLDLAGRTQSLAGLKGSGGVTLGGGALTLTGSQTYSGSISGAGSVTATAGQNFNHNTFNFTTYVAQNGSTVVTGDEGTFSASIWQPATTVANGADFRARFDTTVSGAVTVQSGGTLGGFPAGGYASVTIAAGGRLTLDDGGIGTLFVGTVNLAGGSRLRLGLVDATAAAGSALSQLSLGSTLELGGSAGTPVVLELVTAGNVAQTLNFDPATPYAWSFTTGAGTITGYDPNGFLVDTAGFANAFTGAFSVSQQVSGALQLNYTPAAIPEPSTYAAIFGAAALALALYRSRKK